MEWLIDLYRPLSAALGMSTGAPDSLLLVHGGMVILFLARIATRRSLATWTPFLFVLVAALAKEAADRVAHGAWRMPDRFRSDEHTSELKSLMRISYAGFR